ncbi:MAG: hypothetical protein FWG84_08635 [Bacteroidales bacterium]|nr:hypothetical protein [Bacteroidales bacterium]
MFEITIPIISKTVNLHTGIVQLRFHCAGVARNGNLVIVRWLFLHHYTFVVFLILFQVPQQMAIAV